MNSLAKIAAFLIVIVAQSSCTSSKVAGFGSYSKREAEQMKAELESDPVHTRLLAHCRAAQRVDIFEGLPHPHERKLFAREQKRRDIFRNHDFDFYVPALNLSKHDHWQLVSGVRCKSAFTSWTGPKYCGGFHPDLLLRFYDSTAVVDVHLCFGCGEAIFYGDGSSSHVEFSFRNQEKWKEIQQRNRTKRPIERDENVSGRSSDSLLTRKQRFRMLGY